MGWFVGQTGAPLHQILDVKKAGHCWVARCSGWLRTGHKKGAAFVGGASYLLLIWV